MIITILLQLHVFEAEISVLDVNIIFNGYYQDYYYYYIFA